MSSQADIEKQKQQQKTIGHAENISMDNLHNLKAAVVKDEATIKLEKRLRLKIDLRMMPILVVIYILNYISRNNASAAKNRGLAADLKLTDTEYNTLLSILYVGYIIVQVPSNMIISYFGRPSFLLFGCICGWGTLTILFGVTKSFSGAVVCRFFLGFFEAAFLPGAMFLISKWYTKKELGLRTAGLFCGSLISNAFGPLIAAGILGNMNGDLGHPAWRWVFYVEGAMTVFIGFIAVVVLPDFPTNSRGFTEAQLELAQSRIKEDNGVQTQHDVDEENATPLQALKMAFSDWRVWNLALSLTSMVISLSFNQFFPQLTATLGFSYTGGLLLCAPPWVFATIVTFLNARHSDYVQERFFHIITPMIVGIIGFIIAMSTTNVAARYFSLFLQASSYAGFVLFYTWCAGSFKKPAVKRAIAIAAINAFSQLGNVAGAYIFPSAWGPSYEKSYGICIACFVIAMAGFSVHEITMRRQFKQEQMEAIAATQDLED